MGIQGLTKVLANSKTWRSLTRSKCDLEQLSQQGMKLPNNTNSATKITGEYHNGSCADFILFKDKSGNSLGSVSLFPNGRRTEIEIQRGVVSSASTPKSSEICNQFFDPRNKLYTRKTFEGDTLISEQDTFSEVYKLDDYAKKQSEKFWKQNFQISKSEDKIYQTVVRTGRTPNANGTIDFSQEVMQIETGSNPSKLRLKSKSQMAKDGEVTLQSIEQNGVNMDTTNPYFQTMLMNWRDMLKCAYIEIVKRRGVKGFEPPLKFEEFTGKYIGAAGQSARDNSWIGINTLQIALIGRNKAVQAFTLGHECEHSFTQHLNIHLSGLDNMRSNNPISQRFFDEALKRFKPIKKGTKEYENARTYMEECQNYDKIVWNEKGEIQNKAHNELITEKHADLGGEIEKNYFFDCMNDFIKNFPLFNRNYAIKIFC